GRPARDAGKPGARLHAGQGDVQLSLGPRPLWRPAARCALAAAAAPPRRPGPAGDGYLSVAAHDFEPAGELKFGQVGIANLRVRTLDVERLAAEMRERVQRAPKLFDRAALVLDFGGLPGTPDEATARALLEALREAGALPVALAWGSSDNEALAVRLGLPV